jgi:hypothetical protein
MSKESIRIDQNVKGAPPRITTVGKHESRHRAATRGYSSLQSLQHKTHHRLVL